jgi:non-canonical poly(A) RNA polymerase PAPD5/7
MLEEELYTIKKNQKENTCENYIEKKFNSLINEQLINQDILKSNLNKDILDYQQFVIKKRDNYIEMNEKILDKIQNNINKINTNFKAKLYGSRATNLFLMWSDIDVVICNEKRNKKIKEEINKEEEIETEDNIEDIKYDFLEKLNELLNNDITFVENIKYLNKAKIPIIKIKTTKEYNNIMIDITLQSKDHFGLKCVNLVKKLLKEYDILETLLFPLKTMLKLSELNDPYNGGLSSYALILMIVYFLEYQIKMKKEINKDNVGSLFYEFLFFYGGRMDTNYIDINNINNSMKINKNPFIYILDPLNNENNVGKTSFKYMEVKFIFLIALQILNEPCFCQCHYNKKDNTKDKEEHNLLNKIFFGIKRGKFNNFPLNK